MTAPVCEWCGAPLTGKQERWCDPIHGLKGWRWEFLHNQHGVPVGVSGVEQPPDGSPLLGDGSSRQGGGESRLNGSMPSRVSNGGLQVSVGRMLTVLQGEPFWMTEHHATRLVARALSEKQRQRFERRTA